MSDEKYLTKEKVEALVKAMTAGLQMEIDELKGKLRESEFKRTIAEWAVAGVISKNLQLMVGISDGDIASGDPVELARHVGRNAGYQFLHAAELAFKEHAKYAELRYNADPSRYDFMTHVAAPDAVPDKMFWAKPF